MTGDKPARRRGLFPEFDDWFHRDFPGLPAWRPAATAHSIPVEVTSDDRAYVLRAELPGMDVDDISITVDDNVITVQAEHRESEETKEHSEFRYGSFRRSARLPVPIPADDVEASYADGILTVRVPLPDGTAETPRTIPVKRADGGETS
ncbi:Hsp20/alpha crystallin family protein [Streptomyces sp. Da 82-17]|uniref:Hsp20/alpha crystallin family protein n=1 Tax=Streptomyces sp. Da 82-17 TaxID=3377116 RepID=UPI0038D42D0B